MLLNHHQCSLSSLGEETEVQHRDTLLKGVPSPLPHSYFRPVEGISFLLFSLLPVSGLGTQGGYLSKEAPP